MHVNEDRPAEIRRSIQRAQEPIPPPPPPPPPQRLFDAARYRLNAGVAEPGVGYQPPPVPNAWQGFEFPIVVEVPRDPLVQKLLLPYGEVDEPPQFQGSADPEPQPAANLRRSRRVRGEPPEVVPKEPQQRVRYKGADGRRHYVTQQLDDDLMGHGKHGRQHNERARSQSRKDKGKAPMPMPAKSSFQKASTPKRKASDTPSTSRSANRGLGNQTRETYQPKGESGKGKRTGYSMTDLD